MFIVRMLLLVVLYCLSGLPLPTLPHPLPQPPLPTFGGGAGAAFLGLCLGCLAWVASIMSSGSTSAGYIGRTPDFVGLGRPAFRDFFAQGTSASLLRFALPSGEESASLLPPLEGFFFSFYLGAKL